MSERIQKLELNIEHMKANADTIRLNAPKSAICFVVHEGVVDYYDNFIDATDRVGLSKPGALLAELSSLPG